MGSYKAMTQSITLADIPNGTGAAVRASLNEGAEAIVTENEGNSVPSPTYPFMLWRNNTAKFLRRRNSSNDAWMIVQNYGATTNPDSGNDSSEGYTQGSIWLNTTNNIDWICTSASIGAAVWVDLAAGTVGGANAFGIIAVSGQSNVVADESSDTLTLAGSGVTITSNASTDTVTLAPTFGTTAGTVCQGNDSRLTDSRTPSAHHTTHEIGGSDQIIGVVGPTTFVVNAPRDGTGSAVAGFNSAIAAAIAEGGGRVVIPYGIYNIDNEITIGNGSDPISNIIIEGHGYPILKRIANTTPYILRLAQYATNCMIRCIQINGQKATYTTPCDGIEIVDSYNVIDNVIVTNVSGHGISISSPDISHDAIHNIVQNCRVINTGYGGIVMVDAHYSTIKNNYVENTNWEGIAVDIGTLADGTDWTIVDGNMVNGCATAGVGGIGLDGCTRVVVVNNIIWNSVGTGTFGNGITVQNNRATSDHLIISNNICFGNAGYGLYLKGNDTSSAAGEYPPGTGGFCFSTTDCMITGNNFQGNTDGEIFDDTSNTGNISNAIDATFYMQRYHNSQPVVQLDANDFIAYDRAQNLMSFNIALTFQLGINEAGVFFPPKTAPISPVEGQVYYDSSTHKLRVRTDTSWVDLH
jgi:parallel beta-helix repeat protein